VLPAIIDKKVDLVIADMATPGFIAVDFLKSIAQEKILCQTVLLSAEPVVEHVIQLMKLGAMDFLIKPVQLEQLELCAKRALSLSHSISIPLKPASSQKKKVKIITQDKGVQSLLDLVKKVARSSASVLIQGESGTGKELFAKYIHEKSNRSDQAFIAVNCAALPENLLESELFGHEKGAFTGAISRKLGKFELADKGTLFLDEITEMQFHLQAKLLRVLQENVVDRVGGVEPVDVDVRVIATTNRDAKEAVENGDFREDLFYRLNTIPLIIPPLRVRSNDLELLYDFFIQKYCKIDGRNVKGMTKQAASLLSRHHFPGNVRELENIIHRAVLLADSDLIDINDLMIDSMDFQEQVSDVSVEPGLGPDPGSLKEMEEKMIYKALDQTEGNRTHAALILGISVRTLRNKLNEYKEKK
jgi:two-component system, NtrC family, response regulator AtoC